MRSPFLGVLLWLPVNEKTFALIQSGGMKKGAIRPHVVDALQFLVGKLKNECVTEIERNTGI